MALQSTTPVRRAHILDVSVLDSYLKQHLPAYEGPLTVEQFSFGQSNPTYLLTTPSQRFVLRKKPPGAKSKGAHAVEREYQVPLFAFRLCVRCCRLQAGHVQILSALQRTQVPVPKVHLLCTDETVIGTPFFIMEFVRGRIFVDPSMPCETRRHRHACLVDVLRVLAAIHAVNFVEVGLSGYGKNGKFFERNVATLKHAANLQSKLAGPIPGVELFLLQFVVGGEHADNQG